MHAQPNTPVNPQPQISPPAMQFRAIPSGEENRSSDKQAGESANSPSEDNRRTEDSPSTVASRANPSVNAFYSSSLQKHLPPKHTVSFVKLKATHQFSRQRRLRNAFILMLACLLLAAVIVAILVAFAIDWHQNKTSTTTPTYLPSVTPRI